MESELNLDHLDVIGIPCSDNVSYPDLVYFLEQSRVHRQRLCIMIYAGFRLWMRHEDGSVEKLNFIDFRWINCTASSRRRVYPALITSIV
nr:hypothetical protein [Chromatium okenii]